MKKRIYSIDSLILERIQEHGPGWVFTPRHFLDLGSRLAVDSALARHQRAGDIRRLARGLYDFPRRHPRLGELWPSVDAIADALKERDTLRLQPTGALAANLLGLSEQVPMKVVFLTDGPARTVEVQGLEITLKHTTLKQMATAGRVSGLVIQALRYLGRHHVDEGTIKFLGQRLRPQDKQCLLDDASFAPAWIAKVMRHIATDKERSVG